MPLRIGTSGWHYRDWRGVFYPKTVPSKQWLHHYANCFDTVEINNSFYRLPEASTFAMWKVETPPDFVFTVKASRFLTHYKRLREPDEAATRLLDHASELGEKLGPVLLQLPPDFAVDLARLQAVLDRFAGRARVACEFRHPSWDCDAVYELLASRDAALCLTDRRNRHNPIVRTASWVFLRMHEGTADPVPCYGKRALTNWVDRVCTLVGTRAEGFVYFNNDHRACAVRNAIAFAAIARRAGLDVFDRERGAT